MATPRRLTDALTALCRVFASLEINAPSAITKEAVETSREGLVVGPLA